MLHPAQYKVLCPWNCILPGQPKHALRQQRRGEGAPRAVRACRLHTSSLEPVHAVFIAQQVCRFAQVPTRHYDVDLRKLSPQAQTTGLHLVLRVTWQPSQRGGFTQVGRDGIDEWQEAAQCLHRIIRAQQSRAGTRSQHRVQDNVHWPSRTQHCQVLRHNLDLRRAGQHTQLYSCGWQVFFQSRKSLTQDVGCNRLHGKDTKRVLHGQCRDRRRPKYPVRCKCHQVRRHSGARRRIEACNCQRRSRYYSAQVVSLSPSIAPYTGLMPPQDQHRLIVALDVPTAAAALTLVDALADTILWYKVGLELYLAEGASVVQALKARGKRVFLDLKLHDIPNTVAAATRSAASTGADLLTVHASGGPAMLHAAVTAAHSAQHLQILAVTVLTSMNTEELHAIGVRTNPQEQVMALASMALATGVHGLVCSPLECAALRQAHGSAPLLVVPGIRDTNDLKGDQHRTASAAQAVQSGASMLVVGRPISRASDPLDAASAILQQIAAQ